MCNEEMLVAKAAGQVNSEQKTSLAAALPQYVHKALAAFNDRGFQAYVVGGAVRDLLLGKEPHDFDITTDARPEETVKICQSLGWGANDKLGNNFGCVLALAGAEQLEITTFRGERYSDADAHRPAEVWFTDDLREDLSRRDFTINALAIDRNGRIYDYFGGQQDLQKKILRTVGKAKERYTEDGLRMLRACRFVAQLGFDYVQEEGVLPPFGQEGTPYYLPHCFDFPVERVEGLSFERVYRELDKLLVAPYAGKGLMLMMATGLCDCSCRMKRFGVVSQVAILPELRHLVGLPQNPRFHCYDVWEHTLLAIDNAPRDLAIRWALLLHDIGKGLPEIRRLNKEGQPTDPGHEAKSAEMAAEIFHRYHYPKGFRKLVIWLIAKHMRFAPMLITGEKTLLRWVRSEARSGAFQRQEYLVDAYEKLVQVFLSDMGATHARENHKLMEEGRLIGEQVVALARERMPVAYSDLAVSGDELLKFCSQRKIKAVYQFLLLSVQNGNLPNEKPVLIRAAKKHLNRLRNAVYNMKKLQAEQARLAKEKAAQTGGCKDRNQSKEQE